MKFFSYLALITWLLALAAEVVNLWRYGMTNEQGAGDILIIKMLICVVIFLVLHVVGILERAGLK